MRVLRSFCLAGFVGCASPVPPSPHPPEYEPVRIEPWDAGAQSVPADPFATAAASDWVDGAQDVAFDVERAEPKPSPPPPAGSGSVPPASDPTGLDRVDSIGRAVPDPAVRRDSGTFERTKRPE